VLSTAWTRADDYLFSIRVTAALERWKDHVLQDGAGVCVPPHALIETPSRQHFLGRRSVSRAVDHAGPINQAKLEAELSIKPEDSIGGLIRENGRSGVLSQPLR
jgi:hypothetical protein